jgi:hypothetical protein
MLDATTGSRMLGVWLLLDANPYADFNSSGLTMRYLSGASVVNGVPDTRPSAGSER